MKNTLCFKKKYSWFALIIFINCFAQELRWDWALINLNDIQFPKHFLWGCSDSAMQTEGEVTSDGKFVINAWTDWKKRFPGTPDFGVACERWTRYKEDVQLMKNIGMNAHRFSIEWSKIEPQIGVFDEKAMQHYEDYIDEMLSQGIEPMITLFHHSYPLWFAQKNGFEAKHNNQYFIRFATYVFNRLHSKVKYWLIFNEPVAYVMEAYFRGHYPPGKKNLKLAGKVAKNMLNIHVAIAHIFKNINKSVQIGITHMIYPIDPYRSWNPIEYIGCAMFDSLLNDTTIQFFKTGKFKWFRSRGFNLQACKALDFIGINYYSHITMKQTGPFSLKQSRRQEEKIINKLKTGQVYKVLYAEGLYRAIQKVSILNIPIYVTENGISTDDNDLRDEYLKKHLYVVSKAIQDGYNVRGYFLWTLVDCYGWDTGYVNKYGIYHVDFMTQKRTLRPGYKYLLDTIKKNTSTAIA